MPTRLESVPLIAMSRSMRHDSQCVILLNQSLAPNGYGMRQKTIKKNLRKALLDDGPLSQDLFEYELEEHIDEYIQSKRADRDDFFFAITEHTNEVAMLLIDPVDNVHINEEARTLLRKFWRGAYKHNLDILIPDMAEQLDAGFLYTMGVKVSFDGKLMA